VHPGKILGGRYRVEAALGKGGMGTVYRALDTKRARVVAIKVMHASADDEQDRVRFAREAAAGARLVHRNIVKLIDAGETDAGVAFLAMELVEGPTLRDILVGNSLAPTSREVRLGWLLDIARGVAAAHEAGIVHRDLKPANVVVTPDGAKILDFGIARLTGAATVTVEGFQPGTPRYMAPEQRAGMRVDARADQYAWGLIAYELLTGVLVAEGAAPEGWRDPSEPVSSIIARALRREPSERFATMSELLGALVPILGTQMTAARRPRRGPLFALACVATLVLGASGLVGLLQRTTRPVSTPATPDAAAIATESVESAAPVVIGDDHDFDASPPEPSPTDQAPTRARPRAAEPPDSEKNCACKASIQGDLYNMCLVRMPARCVCLKQGVKLCAKAEWPCRSELFEVPHPRSGASCTGYLEATISSGLEPYEGSLDCSVCYGNVVQKGRGKHMAPCQAIDSDGNPITGTWFCGRHRDRDRDL
jgi:hypothetical protein